MLKNTFFERIWNAIFGNRSEPEGSQRSLINATVLDESTLAGRNYDLEIEERPIRDAANARQLIEMGEWCSELNLAAGAICDAMFVSADGDDRGFKIAKHLDEENSIATDREVKKILDRVLEEVIGGLMLEPAGDRMVKYGDAFASLGIDLKKRQIDSILFLPTFECFRIENKHGRLLQFEQREYLADPTPTVFHPLRFVHWRYRRQYLYGRPLWGKGTIDEWDKLKQATDDLARAARELGINPNVHRMPAGTSSKYQETYINLYEQKKKRGIVTDFYLANSGDLTKVANFNPSLTGLIENILLRRRRVAMSTRLPAWMFGLETTGAKDISGQPAIAHALLISRFRQSLSEGMRQICNLELALKDIPKERWQYRFEFPPIQVDPYHEPSGKVATSKTNGDPEPQPE